MPGPSAPRGDDLFAEQAAAAERAAAPLADRMRPRTLDEVVGQRHLLTPGAPLSRLLSGEPVASVLMYGPPGTGKTTFAQLVANAREASLVQLSAVTAGVRDVREVIERAREQLRLTGRRTVLFIDEVHRFNKAQQDALLPAVEHGWVTLLAATTENPFFTVIGPLLSRSLLVTLHPLEDEEVRTVIRRALADPRGLGGRLTVTAEAEEHLVTMGGGDARRALTALEVGASAARAADVPELDLPLLERAAQQAALRYDRTGDQHYDVISAFIKSLRGSDPDAALHYLARMLEAGEDPRFIARRLVILASEDIGLADPDALSVAVAAAHAVELVGLPEGRLNLAHATVALALAPKSNAVIRAIDAAQGDVRAGRVGPVPAHLRDASYAGARRLGHGRGYRYPHDFAGGLVDQQYLPDELVGRRYWVPTERDRPAPQDGPPAGPG